jgi:hypothetical protein
VRIKEIFTPYSIYTTEAQKKKAITQSNKLFAEVDFLKTVIDKPGSQSNMVIMNKSRIMQVVTSDFVFTVDAPISKLLAAIREDVLPCNGDWRQYGSEDFIRWKYAEEYPCGDSIDSIYNSDSDKDGESDDGFRFENEANEISERIGECKTGYFLWPVSYVLRDKTLSAHEIDFMVNVMDKHISFFKEFLIHGPMNYDGSLGAYETLEVRPFEVLFSYDSDTERSTFGGFGFFELDEGEEDGEEVVVYTLHPKRISRRRSTVDMDEVEEPLVILRVGAADARDQNWKRRRLLAMMRHREASAFLQNQLAQQEEPVVGEAVAQVEGDGEESEEERLHKIAKNS